MLVTGFGRFRSQDPVTRRVEWKEVNASTEAVKILKSRFSRSGYLRLKNMEAHSFIFDENLAVTYQMVDDYKYPWGVDVVINVGLSTKQTKAPLRVEERAQSKGYNRPDIEKKLCENKALLKAPLTCRHTELDLDKLVDLMGEETLYRSTNAGKYICEYFYYRSLGVTPNSVFVHVSDHTKTDRPEHSIRQIATGLEQLMFNIVNNLEELTTGKEFPKDCADCSLLH